MEHIMSKDILQVYPNFNLPFETHVDANDRQLGGLIILGAGIGLVGNECFAKGVDVGMVPMEVAAKCMIL
eukprot:15347193-Ditylum_brightwellii.AAC.1